MSLEDVREQKKSKGLYVVIGLLLVGMAGFGTSQFGFGSGGGNPAALKLGDSEISSRAFQSALNANRKRYSELAPAMVEDLTLSQLRQSLALTEYLKVYPLVASNPSIDNMIRNNPNFFDNGKFSEERFHRLVTVDAETYRESLSQGLAIQMFQNVLTASSVISAVEIAPFTQWKDLSRDILVAKIPQERFAEQTADDSEIQAFYDQHKADFMTDEHVNIDYVELDPEAYFAKVAVSDAEILAAAQPSRTVNYYLFKDVASAEKAQASLASGKDMASVKVEFADVIDDSDELPNLSARADADSPIPQSALDSIFALTAKGATTAPIEIDGSTYLFELVSEPKSDLSEADKAKAKLALQKRKAAPELAALSEKLSKAFYDSKTPDLLTISETTALPIQHSGMLALHAGEGVLAVQELVSAIDSGDKTIGKLQDPIIMGEHIIIYRLSEVKAPQQQPLAEVKDAVKAALIAEKTDKQIKKAVDELIAASKTEGLAAAAAANNYPTQSYKDFKGQVPDGGVLDAIAGLLIMQQAPQVGDKQARELTSMTGEVYVYVDTAVRLGEGNTDEATQKRLAATLAMGVGQLEVDTFMRSITARADIKMRSGLLQNKSDN